MANDLASSIKMDVRSTQPCRKDFDFTIPADTVTGEREKMARDFASTVNLPGFRKGKAPAAMIRTKYAAEIEQELKRRFVYAAFDRIGEDKELDIVSCGLEKEPELKDGEDFKFTMNADLAPEFALGDYKALKADVPAEEITEEAVAERVKMYRSMYATYADAAGPARAEDMLKVDYSSNFELPEDATPGLTRQVKAEGGYLWLSDPEIIPGSMKALDGAEIGKEYQFEAVYAADYREEALAGKTLQYTVKVLGIQRKQDLADAELCEKARVGSIDEFIKMIRSSLENEAKGKRRGALSAKVYDELDKAVPSFELPPGVFQTEVTRELRRLANNLVKSEADVEEFKAKTEEHRKTAEEAAKKSLRRTFILRKIAKLEDISINQQDVDAQLKGMSSYYGYKEKEFRAMLEQSGGMDELQLDILNGKVMEFLVSKVEEAAAK